MHITCCAYYDSAFSTKGTQVKIQRNCYILFISFVLFIVEKIMFFFNLSISENTKELLFIDYLLVMLEKTLTYGLFFYRGSTVVCMW